MKRDARPDLLSRLQFVRVIARHILLAALTAGQVASSESAQAFLLIGSLVLFSATLLYTGWSYWVFRGKGRADVGYH